MVLSIVAASLYIYFSNEPVEPASVTYVEKISPSDANYQFQSKTTSATLLAVGDILIHSSVYNAAKTPAGYDFKPMFKYVKPYISQADIAVANSESIIGGAQIGLSTYPIFNSPYEVGDALKDAGFDVVTMANNHTLDRGERGVTNAIHYWDKIGMVHTGSFLSEAERNRIVTVEKNGIVFSFLAYTYGTNGIPTPAGKSYLVNRIDLPLMERDIQAAKAQSDVVVVSLHFGTEYQRYPNENQKKLVKILANQGVDIILGSHPHVLQPYTWVEGKSGHKTFVIYSLGNFISGQMRDYKDIGGMLQLTVEKTNGIRGEKVVVTHPSFVPTWVQRRAFTVVPLKSAGNYGLAQAPLVYQEIMLHMVEK